MKAISENREGDISLKNLPNIGSTLANLLNEAGITSAGQLYETGAAEAFIRIRAIDPDACYCKLCALEGAIEGIRWHDLTPAKKSGTEAFVQHDFKIINYPVLRYQVNDVNRPGKTL